MITANGNRQSEKSSKNKEEKMNARKVVCGISVLVIGLAIALQITALSAPPSVEYRPGVNLIYRGVGYNVAPKVSVSSHQVSEPKLPSFYRVSNNDRSATPQVKQAHPGLMSQMYVVPQVRVPTY